MRKKAAWLLAALMFVTAAVPAQASNQKNVTDMNNQNITIGGEGGQSSGTVGTNTAGSSSKENTESGTEKENAGDGQKTQSGTSGTGTGTGTGSTSGETGTSGTEGTENGTANRDTTLDNQELKISIDKAVTAISKAAGSDIGALNTDQEIGKDRRAELDAALKKLEDKGYGVSFLLFDLKTNSGYFKNADTEYPSAGTIVGPYVAALAERKIDKDELNLKTTKLNRSDLEKIEGGAGTIQNDPSTETYTLADVMERTVKQGDNNGYALLYQEYGNDFFATWLKSGKVSGDYTKSKWPNYTVRDLTAMWVSIAEYFTSDRGVSKQVREMYSGADQSFIQDKLGGLYTVYSCPGYATASSVWHDAALVMDETYPYLMVVMTNVKWEASNTEDRESLEELATALEGVHSDMVHPEKSIKPAVATATPTPTAEATPTPSPAPEKEESKGGIPTAVWVVLAVILVLAGGLTARILYVKEMKRRRRMARMQARRRQRQEMEEQGRSGRRPASGQRRSGADGTGQRRSSRERSGRRE